MSAMAARCGLSSCATLARRFHAATGYQPMEYVHALRVEEAKQMLETQTTGVDGGGAPGGGLRGSSVVPAPVQARGGIAPAQSDRRKYARIGWSLAAGLLSAFF